MSFGRGGRYIRMAVNTFFHIPTFELSCGGGGRFIQMAVIDRVYRMPYLVCCKYLRRVGLQPGRELLPINRQII